MLIYGDPGCGKTTLAGTGGQGTLLVHPPFDHMDPVIGSGAEEWTVRTWGDMLAVLEWARHEGGTFDWIWLDSISLWQDAGMDDIWEKVIADKPHRLAAYYDRGEYRINMGRLSEWVRYMVGCDLFNFGITAHPFWMNYRNTDVEGDDVQKLMPWIQGKGMPQRISGYVHLVGYMTVQNSKQRKGEQYRKIEFNGNENFYAKDQFGAFKGGKIIDPTMPKIMSAVTAAREPRKGHVAPRPKPRRRKEAQ